MNKNLFFLKEIWENDNDLVFKIELSFLSLVFKYRIFLR